MLPQPTTDHNLATALQQGIFTKDQFPYNTKAYQCSPKDVANAIAYWTLNPVSWPKATAKYGVREQLMWELEQMYPEIQSALTIARSRKAKVHAEMPANLYHELPDNAYETDKFGNSRLSQAFVTYMRDKANIHHRLAAYYETGSALQHSKVDSTVRSVNLNITKELPADTREAAQALEDLLTPPQSQ